jgi:tRNA (guanine-N7-)-methyltransferase
MKVQPALLQQFQLHPAQSDPLPMDWASIFVRQAPLAVEIGFGNGEFLAWWAQQNPDWDFVGIELPADCLSHAVGHLQMAGVTNVRLIRGDARYLLRELFPPASLEKVLMQFPMPWPKEKHAKHRVYSPSFAATLADVLGEGGVFELVTDREWYATDTVKVLGADGHFELCPLEINPQRAFRTRYEQKWLEDGRPIHRVLARIARHESAPRLLLSEPMEIVHLSVPPTSDQMQILQGRRFQQADAVFEIKEVFQARDGWFLYLVSSDQSFSQHYYLRVQKKPDGRVLIRIHGQPRPYHTPAIKFSLQELGRQLA